MDKNIIVKDAHGLLSSLYHAHNILNDATCWTILENRMNSAAVMPGLAASLKSNTIGIIYPIHDNHEDNVCSVMIHEKSLHRVDWGICNHYICGPQWGQHICDINRMLMHSYFIFNWHKNPHVFVKQYLNRSNKIDMYLSTINQKKPQYSLRLNLKFQWRTKASIQRSD